MGKTVTGEITAKYLAEFGNDIPSLTLAKIIYQENPLHFTGVDHARTSIRGLRGQMGDSNRNDLKDKRFTKPAGSLAPFKIPTPEGKDYEPIILDKKFNNLGVMSDFHIPNHRDTPISLAVDKLQKSNINCLVLNGDILDNTPFSRHDGEKPEAKDVKAWFDKTEVMFEWLQHQFQGVKLIWTEGNHDFWYRRWMVAHAHQLSKDPYFSLQERLNISEYGIRFIPQTTFLKAGKLNIMHGHQLSGKFGVGENPAKVVYNKAKKSVMIGHVHTLDKYTAKNLDGEFSTTYTTGCLCTLTPDYQPIGGRAAHGFAQVQVEKSGDFNVNNYQIHNGKIL